MSQKPDKSITVEKLNVEIYNDTKIMGQAAADQVTEVLKAAIAEKGHATLILATGASQFSFIEAFKDKELDWPKITVFHLDEYVGMSDQHPASFVKYLKERILDHVSPKAIHFLNGDAPDADAEAQRYEDLLKQHEVDCACIGIGENGHIAFNDPPVADFDDPKLVKVVELDDDCRKQQLGEGWFPTFEDVPTHALSQTIPAMMRCKYISCVVPDERKATAVKNTLNAPIGTACPATILRTHPNTVLYLDAASASKL